MRKFDGGSWLNEPQGQNIGGTRPSGSTKSAAPERDQVRGTM